jgi:hypothetical protein
MKRDDINADILDMLVFWWRYERGWLPVAGYPEECPSTRGYKVSGQYDDANGAGETDARGMLAKRIGHAVASIEEPYRSALYLLARNRATGVSVWISPRLPTDDVLRAELVADAVDKLAALV